MFMHAQTNNREIAKALENAEQAWCAVAFIGEKAEHYFQTVKQCKIVCNLSCGATNPHVLEALMKRNGFQIKHNPKLHAKVYLTENTAIVSSSNLSANGLGLEGEEITGWIECGYKVEAKPEIQSVRDWFETLWSDSSDVTPEDIAMAKAEWANRRTHRPGLGDIDRFSDLVLNRSPALLNRNIYFAITFGYFSKEAEAKLAEVQDDPLTRPRTSAYEDWPKLPQDAYLIDLYSGPRGGLQYDGIYKTPAQKELVSFIDADKKESTLFLCQEVDHIYGTPVTNRDIIALRRFIARIVAQKRAEGEDAICLPIEELMEQIQ